jgi:thiamine-monophosphate kinase
LGNFYAFSAMQQFSTDIEFKPYPDIELSQIMAAYASSCIDTSDGLFHALYTVMKLNGIGITLNENLFNSIPKILQEYCVQLQVSPLTLLAGIVGEYELLFTIPRDKNEAFLKAIEKSQITVHNIGAVTNEKGLSVTLKDHTQSIDLDALVQAYMHSKGDIKTYIETLKTYTEF